MAGLSRPKDGVATLAYVPAIHALAASKAWKPGTRPGMTWRGRCKSSANEFVAVQSIEALQRVLRIEQPRRKTDLLRMVEALNRHSDVPGVCGGHRLPGRGQHLLIHLV